jgi:hypothetical protein
MESTMFSVTVAEVPSGIVSLAVTASAGIDGKKEKGIWPPEIAPIVVMNTANAAATVT